MTTKENIYSITKDNHDESKQENDKQKPDSGRNNPDRSERATENEWSSNEYPCRLGNDQSVCPCRHLVGDKHALVISFYLCI